MEMEILYFRFFQGLLKNNLVIYDAFSGYLKLMYNDTIYGGARLEKISRNVFTKKFKEEAVKMVIDGGLGMPEIGRSVACQPSPEI